MENKWKVGIAISLLPFAIGWVTAKGEYKYKEGQTDRSIAYIKEAVNSIVEDGRRREADRLMREDRMFNREQVLSREINDLTAQVKVLTIRQDDMNEAFASAGQTISGIEKNVGEMAENVTKVKTNQVNYQKELSANISKVEGLTEEVTRIKVLQEERFNG